MTPHAFITKWRASALKERSASQEHFIDLCRLLDEPTPAEADPSGETYCFERGAHKDAGGDGWADVWKRHHFAWEYKGKRADLDAAFDQLRQYSLALENPPLLIVSDMVRFRIRTNWTNSVSRTHEFELDDLSDASTRDRLKWAFSEPDRLRPGETRQSLTERVAASFASVAQALRERGHEPQAVAHFVNRLVFCMFADDVGLLRGGAGARIGVDRRDPVDAPQRLRGSARPDPEATRRDRVPRRGPDAGQRRAGVAGGRRRDRQPAVPGREAADHAPGRELRYRRCRPATSCAPDLLSIVPEKQLREDQSDLASWNAGRPEGPLRADDRAARRTRGGSGWRRNSRAGARRPRNVMLAGNWKTSRMVAYYSAGATAERGAGGALPVK